MAIPWRCSGPRVRRSRGARHVVCRLALRAQRPAPVVADALRGGRAANGRAGSLGAREPWLCVPALRRVCPDRRPRHATVRAPGRQGAKCPRIAHTVPRLDDEATRVAAAAGRRPRAARRWALAPPTSVGTAAGVGDRARTHNSPHVPAWRDTCPHPGRRAEAAQPGGGAVDCAGSGTTVGRCPSAARAAPPNTRRRRHTPCYGEAWPPDQSRRPRPSRP